MHFLFPNDARGNNEVRLYGKIFKSLTCFRMQQEGERYLNHILSASADRVKLGK
jgi:hypothetical protein